MESIGIQKLAEELKKLNPGVDVLFKADASPAIIIVGGSNCANLNLPAEYYCNGKKKHNMPSGWYESFERMTIHEYLKMFT